MTHQPVHYGASYWLARAPQAARPAYPRHRGELAVDVAIVGGGLTGCTAAYLFAKAGVRTVVLEADRIGHGASGRGAGILAFPLFAQLRALQQRYGLRAAWQIWEASRLADLELARLLRRLRIRCDLVPQSPACVPAAGDDEGRLQREYEARRAAGLEATWVNRSRLLLVAASSGPRTLRVGAGFSVDPYRACLGIAAAASRCGAAVFERSPVKKTEPGSGGVEIRTAGGTVRARTVVIATNSPGAPFRSLGGHFKVQDTYTVLTPALPGAVRKELGARNTLVRDTAAPSHLLRWTADDRLLFTGADQPKVAVQSRDRTLVQRTGQLMYQLSLLCPAISGIQPEFGWDARVARTDDGLGYAGVHRHYPGHLFALGWSQQSLGLACLAGRILLRHYTGEPAKEDALFGFARMRG